MQVFGAAAVPAIAGAPDVAWLVAPRHTAWRRGVCLLTLFLNTGNAGIAQRIVLAVEVEEFSRRRPLFAAFAAPLHVNRRLLEFLVFKRQIADLDFDDHDFPFSVSLRITYL